MADEQTMTANPEGVARTAEGAIADQSSATTPPTQETTTSAKSDTGTTLLTEGTKPAAEAKSETKETASGAPEKYEDFKVPEGYTIEPELRAKIDPMFKDLGLSQESAQRLVDFYLEQNKAAFEAPFTAWQDMLKEWRTESESHPDLRGKLGPGQEVNVRIGKLIDSLPADLASGFRQLMDSTGAGNNVAFIRALDSWAAQLTEGTHVAGNGPSKAGQSAPGTAPPTAAAALWPNLPSSATRQ